MNEDTIRSVAGEESTCPYCGDGMESIGTLNHIECVTEVMKALDELDSYNGHLKWMDKHYPLDIPYFAESEDVGCQVMRLSRKVMRLAAAVEEMRHALEAEAATLRLELDEALFQSVTRSDKDRIQVLDDENATLRRMLDIACRSGINAVAPTAEKREAMIREVADQRMADLRARATEEADHA